MAVLMNTVRFYSGIFFLFVLNVNSIFLERSKYYHIFREYVYLHNIVNMLKLFAEK